MSIVSLPRMAAGVVCVLMLAAIPAFAEDRDDTSSAGHGPGRRGEGPKHRKALAEACADLKQGDECKVEFDEHTLEGTCETNKRTETLFCRPDMQRMDRAAFEACKDEEEGDACTFERRDGEGKVEGTCEKARMPRREHRDQRAAGEGHEAQAPDAARGEHRERPLVCMPDRD